MSSYKKVSSVSFESRYIPTGRQQTDDFPIDDMATEYDEKWLAKARRLQARRWRKIKHQMA